MTISVVVADDQPIVRSGLVMILEAEPDISVVGEASNGADAVRLTRVAKPDIVVMDVRMPEVDGIAATRMVTADEQNQDPDRLTKVLILTTFSDDAAVHDALRAGASGFLLKHAAPQDLVSAIRRLAGGDAWIDPSVAGKVIDALARVPDGRKSTASSLIDNLTAREREVLSEMALGLSNTEIAKRLFLSEATVKTHVARVIMKTGSRDRTQAVVIAYRSGLAQP
jgi:DNA-binding NarL/FixJ family response regulator